MASTEAPATQSTNGAPTRPDIEVEKPATGQVIATVPDLGPEEVKDLAAKARAAQPGWEALGFEGRGRVMRRAQKWMLDHADRVIETIVSETGKTYEDAQLAEISYGASAFGFWAKNAGKYLADERVKSSSPLVLGRKLIVRFRPLGLVDEVDMIMFTGSTRTGKKVMERAAQTLTPVSLELGGKDPMIVLRDADLERAANAAAYYSMQNGGQTCISVERVYVEEPVYDQFVAKVTEKVRALRQGDPSGGPGTVEVGAVTFPPQYDIVDKHVQDALAKGAKALTGGHGRREHGMYYEPTVLVDVDHTMEAMTEETFGPTLPIMKVADAEEAIRMANDSPYGLGASVFTKDVERGEAVARRVESGAVVVNDAMLNYSALELPMGGWKASRLGSRHGAGGIRKYARQQSILITRLAPKRDVHMFPYNKRTTGLLLRLFKLIWGRGKRS